MASRKNDEWVSVRLPEEDRQKLLRIAEQDERTIAGTIRLAVREFIATREAAAEEVAA